jgi:L-lactate dehydrogenase
VHLAERLAVSPACVDAYVVGEHGMSNVFLWSSAHIGGMRVQDSLMQRGIVLDEFRQQVEREVRYANIRRFNQARYIGADKRGARLH